MKTIHDRALIAAGQFNNSQKDLISIIQELDQSKSYREKKCHSSYQYCMEFLKLPDNTSLDLIAIARTSVEIPELKKAVENELITIANARRITSVITPENKTHWLKLAQDLPKQKLEKEIAKVKPETIIKEKAKYVSEDRLRLELGVSEELMNDLKRAQEILSRKTKTHNNFEKTLACVLKDFLKREDPVRKAERAAKKVSKNRSGLGRPETKSEAEKKTGAKSPFKRKPLEAKLKHQLNLRDQAQCTHRNQNSERCEERKWLAFHHIQPVSLGGKDTIENLTTLCWAHHDLVHQLNFPIGNLKPEAHRIETVRRHCV